MLANIVYRKDPEFKLWIQTIILISLHTGHETFLTLGRLPIKEAPTSKVVRYHALQTTQFSMC